MFVCASAYACMCTCLCVLCLCVFCLCMSENECKMGDDFITDKASGQVFFGYKRACIKG
jgi:hypothetical protein